jgi:predicted RNase H-like HicB family nuclease
VATERDTVQLVLTARVEWDAEDRVYISRVEQFDITTWGKDIPDAMAATHAAVASHMQTLQQLGQLEDAVMRLLQTSSTPKRVKLAHRYEVTPPADEYQVVPLTACG